MDLMSVSPAPMHLLAGNIAGVLDSSADFAPDRGGPRDPMRRLTQGLSGIVSAELEKDSEELWVLFEQSESPGFNGDFTVHPPGRHLFTHNLDAGLGLGQIEDPLRRTAFVDLAARLFVAMDGFYGSVKTTSMIGHALALKHDAVERGALAVPDWSDLDFQIWDRWIQDVWWVNFFGPAYVARWGRSAFENLGMRRRELDNGGMMVWASEEPPVHDDDMKLISDYPHKQSFYAELGLETFIHESLEIPEPGQRVPTLEEHADAAPGPPTDIEKALVAAAPADDGPAPEWVAGLVAALRAIDWFASGESGEQVAAGIWGELVAGWGDVAANDDLAELMVAAGDSTRVWWRDTEADVGPGAGVYAELVSEWAAISRGALAVSDVVETWDAPAGPVSVTFRQDAEDRELNPVPNADFVDLSTLAHLNLWLEGRQFELVTPFDQTAYVVCLTAAEKASLEARGWTFA